MADTLEKNLQEIIGSLVFQVAQLQTANTLLLTKVEELQSTRAFQRGPTLVPPAEPFPQPLILPTTE